MKRASLKEKIRDELVAFFPKSLRLRFNPRRYSIERFVKKVSSSLKKGSRILDAGAGPCPYKPMFNHCNYEATDFEKISPSITFVSGLHKIPRKGGYYDAVLCTEVLEHVPSPSLVIKELYRVLTKGGSLFLTTPQEYMLHQEPYNYFYFTKHGLSLLMREAGFKQTEITPMGGFFWMLADAVRFNGIAAQYRLFPLLYYPLRIIEFPFTQILFPLILFYLDGLDRDKKWTMGYTVRAIK